MPDNREMSFEPIILDDRLKQFHNFPEGKNIKIHSHLQGTKCTV